jgi:hypothetical protein
MIRNFLIPGIPFYKPNNNDRSHLYKCHIKGGNYRFKLLFRLLVAKYDRLHGVSVPHVRGNAGGLKNGFKLLRLYRLPGLKISYRAPTADYIKEISALYVKHDL